MADAKVEAAIALAQRYLEDEPVAGELLDAVQVLAEHSVVMLNYLVLQVARARMLDGAANPGDLTAWPSTAAEFAARYNARPAEERDEWVQHAVADAQLALVCVAENHRGQLDVLKARELARLRDAADVESTPEVVMDAAFASQREWWTPGDDVRRPVVQLEQHGDEVRGRPVIVAKLIEEVADATYKAAVAEIGADQREKDALIAESVYPLGSVVLGDAPSRIAQAIRKGAFA